MVNKVFLMGHVLKPGPRLTAAADGAPRCRLQVRLEDQVIAVEVRSQHARWPAQHVGTGDVVLVEGKLHCELPQAWVVLAWQVKLVVNAHDTRA